MSTTFDRGLRVAAVLACGAMLLLSTYARNGFDSFRSESTPKIDKHDVRAGLAILERARTPIQALQPCDAVKALLPEKFDAAAGNRKISEPSGEAIVCFRNDIDYEDALKAAALRGFFWQTGIGGAKIVAFAPSEAAFRQAAAKDKLAFAAGELTPFKMWMDRLHSHGSAKLDARGWVLASSATPMESLFGPYIDMTPGDYLLTLTFESVDRDSCGLIAQKDDIEITVAGDARGSTIVPRQSLALQPELVGTRCQLLAALSFHLTAAAKSVETPMWFSGPLPLRLVAFDFDRYPVP